MGLATPCRSQHGSERTRPRPARLLLAASAALVALLASGGRAFTGCRERRGTLQWRGRQPHVRRRQDGQAVQRGRADRYKMLSQQEHVLMRPDMYIGPTAIREETAWILDGKTNKLKEQGIRFSPALIQIYNEILVNAVDRQFDAKNPMTRISIKVNETEGSIMVENDGGSMPIEKHTDSGLYVPTMVFGEFMSGDNFDDSGARYTGGRNGIGAKATNVFSKRFELEVTDPTSGLKFFQLWEDNMLVRHDPDITPLLEGEAAARPQVRVTFWPDLPRFGLSKIDRDHVRFFQTRTYDAAACTGPDVDITFNGKQVLAQGFEDYARSALGDEIETTQIIVKKQVRAEVAVAISKGSFRSLGLVNGIRCNDGTHIRVVADQLAADISKLGSERGKSGNQLSPRNVRKHIQVIVKALVDRPDFDSQMKSRLTTTADMLGYSPTLPKEFVQRVADLGILDAALKEQKSFNLKQMKSGTPTKLPMAKLDDAALAGRGKEDCTLILTEGDSAKALAVAGVAKLGRRNYGIFPLRGKVLNVRSATQAKLATNTEIKLLVQIIGLTYGVEYTSMAQVKKLRYQKVMIFSDQDLDGHHIAGLVINFFHFHWPSLLELCPDFIQRFASPIVKVFQKSSKKSLAEFFTQADFDLWRGMQPEGWEKQKRVKYYKGLGTSTREEAIQYFSDPDRHILQLDYQGEDDDEAVERAFGATRADDRKEWINNADYAQELNYSKASASYVAFFNKQFVHFSKYDCWRSIPLLVDGLKPSQRKVLHVVRRFKSEKKVAQVTGIVSSETSYHHGEQSLVKTIVGLAQNFVGTNNVNLLSPNGQFGSRLLGPGDYASERYIFTEASKFCPLILKKEDDAILRPQFEDGQQIEPKELLPIIPLVLLNGCKGIGTGWATDGPSYHPLEVTEGLIRLIQGEEPEEMLPWYVGFKGTVARHEGRLVSRGRWSLYSSMSDGLDDTIEITELPVGVWTDDFVDRTEKLSKQKDLEMVVYKCMDHDDQNVHLLIGFSPDRLEKLRDPEESTHQAVGRLLQLEKRIRNNLWLFHSEEMDSQPSLHSFSSPLEVLRAFYRVRLKHYVRRRDKLLKRLRHLSAFLGNRVKFVRAVGNQEIKLQPGQSLIEVEALLEEMGFQKLRSKEDDGSQEQEEGEEDEAAEGDFDYLLRMPYKSWTREKAEELEKQQENQEKELARLESMTAETLWLEDLEEFREVYKAHLDTLETPVLEASAPEKKDAKRSIHRGRQRVEKSSQSALRKAGGANSLPADLPGQLSAMSVKDLKILLKSHKALMTGKRKDMEMRLLVLMTSEGVHLAEWQKESITSLRKYAAARGLQTTGTKEVLAQRIHRSKVTVPLDCALKADLTEELKRRGADTKGTVKELRERVAAERLRVK